MAVMEFLGVNLYETTTSLIVNSNTDSAQFLFDKSPDNGYSSAGYGTDGTSAVISVLLPSNTVISNVILQKHNLKSFRIYYNSVTANSLISTTTNSDSSTYLLFASVTCNSVDIQMIATITPSQEKSIGELIVSNRKFAFERNPNYKDYDPFINRKQVRHEMPDGGVVLYSIKDKFRGKLKWKFITDAFQTQLSNLYATAQPFVFIPFPTSTGWDGKAYEVVWSGKYDFTHANNVKAAGWEGSMTLEQTPGL
jgi:hypothetical protein